MSEATLTRDEEIKQIHEKYRTFYQLGGGLFLVLIGVLIGAVIFSDEPGYGTNIYTELLSVTLTIGVLNVLQERRDNRNRLKDLQEQLVREAGSPIHATAISAIDTMRKRGWLGRKFSWDVTRNDKQSLLENADLSNADLHGANLSNANLDKANLYGTNLNNADLLSANLNSVNLEKADLTRANLQYIVLTGARLWDTKLARTNLRDANLNSAALYQADLTSARMYRTNLTGANLNSATLTNADLSNANLTNAYLGGANLTGTYLDNTNLSSTDLIEANLSDAFVRKSTIFNESTILPDESNWTEGGDLAADFGAETREIVNEDWDEDDFVSTYTFADGTKRRYQYRKGWLDDRDGNPLEDK